MVATAARTGANACPPSLLAMMKTRIEAQQYRMGIQHEKSGCRREVWGAQRVQEGDEGGMLVPVTGPGAYSYYRLSRDAELDSFVSIVS
jgi:hypothetical protein